MVGIYIVKVTNYPSGTVVKTLLAPQSYAPTVTATSRTSNTNGKITVTATANHHAALYKFNIF